MIWLAAIGGASFLLVCIVGGARLLLLARRTRGLPETVLGAGLLLLGGVATPLAGVARAETGLDLDLRAALFLLQSILMSLGMASFALFTQRVFRPESGWARCLTVGLTAGMLCGVVLMGVDPGYTAALRVPGTGYLLQQVFLLATLGWTAGEALRYLQRLQRQLVLGLADPIVAHRIGLWGGGVALATGMTAITIATEQAGVNLIITAPGAALIGFLGLGSSASIYFAFFLPETYARLIVDRARRAEAANA